jgi:hypothetical protein
MGPGIFLSDAAKVLFNYDKSFRLMMDSELSA